MKKIAWFILPLLAGGACQGVKLKPAQGTDVSTGAHGTPELVTYVTEDEYERMSPQERERLHVAMGASVSVPIFGGDATRPPLTREKLDKAIKASDDKDNR